MRTSRNQESSILGSAILWVCGASRTLSDHLFRSIRGLSPASKHRFMIVRSRSPGEHAADSLQASEERHAYQGDGPTVSVAQFRPS
jgi:hypothetical protein